MLQYLREFEHVTRASSMCRPAVGSAANPQVLDVIRAYIASQTSFTGISQKAKPL
jgi:hypothetical protein